MSDGQGAAFPKVAMLAANLAITSIVPGANPRIPESQRERGILGAGALNYRVVQQESAGEPALHAELPDAVLPYLRKITIENAFDVLDSSNGNQRVVLQNEPDGVRFNSRPSGPGAAAQVVLNYGGDKPSRTLALKYRFDTVEFCPTLPGVRDPYRLDFKSCAELKIDREATESAASQLNNDLYYTADSQVLRPNTDWGVCMRWKTPPRTHGIIHSRSASSSVCMLRCCSIRRTPFPRSRLT